MPETVTIYKHTLDAMHEELEELAKLREESLRKHTTDNLLEIIERWRKEIKSTPHPDSARAHDLAKKLNNVRGDLSTIITWYAQRWWISPDPDILQKLGEFAREEYD